MLNGDLLEIIARPTFASRKSMEIEVVVRAESLSSGRKRVTTRGHFTFVSLDAGGGTLPIPPLEPANAAEQERFDDGLARYEARKRARGG